MANGQSNHPEPLDRHGVNEEEAEENNEEENVDMSTSEQDELLDEMAAADIEAEEEQDYSALERTLDQLDSCLDQLDQKNDDLNAKLRALLADSRQEYEQLTSARLAGDAGSSERHQNGESPGC